MFVAATAAVAYATAPQTVRRAEQRPQPVTAEVPRAEVVKVKPATLALRTVASSAITASFSVQNDESQQAVWTENFDAGASAWTLTPDADNNVTWSLKKSTGEGRAYSEIDANDVLSLFVEGPYQVYKRAIATATSSAVTVPANGVLHAYIGYSANLNDDYCSLAISVSADDFATSTEVWNSIKQEGGTSFAWRKVESDLSQWAGQSVRLRFTYGPGTKDTFGTGGYMGDFYIDGLDITGVQQVESVSVKTGETVKFVDTTSGKVAEWQWSFPGGTPSTSTEQSPEVYYTADGEYDVILTVSDGENSGTVTKSKFVKVTGTEPVAHILPPASFRYQGTYLPFVAPLAQVTYEDASTGYPTAWHWTFSGTTPSESDEQNPTVSYDYLHKQTVNLEVSNSHGSSTDAAEVSVEYEGYATNVQPGDLPTVISLEEKGVFPGSNQMKITEYAERFSRPSRPMLVYGAAVYFTSAEATALLDQIADIGVHLCTSENGLPGKKIDSTWWRVFELETASSSATTIPATTFEFTKPQIVNDEFFMKVDGIPESNDSCNVAFATARLRDQGNTAYMYMNKQWRPLTGYFDADGQTSYYIMPMVVHSVLTFMPVGTQEIQVGAAASTTEQPVFSYFGYKTPEVDSDWCRVVSEPNGLTLDTLLIQCDQLPPSLERREAMITLTDSIDTIQLRVVQSKNGSVDASQIATHSLSIAPSVVTDAVNILLPDNAERLAVYAADGRLMYNERLGATQRQRAVLDVSVWRGGIYIVRTEGSGGASVARFIKR